LLRALLDPDLVSPPAAGTKSFDKTGGANASISVKVRECECPVVEEASCCFEEEKDAEAEVEASVWFPFGTEADDPRGLEGKL
jgi:hypothetical protein